MSQELTPAALRTLMDRLSQVENEARTLRAQIEQRLVENRRSDTPDRRGQPVSPPGKHRTR